MKPENPFVFEQRPREQDVDYTPEEKVRVLSIQKIAEGKRLIKEAKQTAQGITEDVLRSRTLVSIAETQAEAGDVGFKDTFEETKQTAQKIENYSDRSQALVSTTKAQVEAKDIKEAKQTAQGIEDDYYRFQALASIAKAQAEAGDIKEAKQTAQGIEDDYYRFQALASIAKAQAEAGDIKEAKQTAQGIEDHDDRSQVLASIAKAQAEAGDVEFKDTIEEAKQTAQGIKNYDDRFQTLVSIAEVQIEVGDIEFKDTFERAKQTAQEIEDDDFCSRSLTSIAKAQAEAGDIEFKDTFEKAKQTAQEIEDHDDRSQVLAYIAKAQAEAGDVEEAKQTAQGIKNNGDRSQVLASIAKAQAEAGDIKEAKQTAQGIEYDDDRSRSLTSIAKAQVEAGDIKEAKQTAQVIEDDGYRTRSLTFIAKAQAEAGDVEFKDTFKEAKQTAQGIVGGDYRSQALAYIAKAQTEIGDIKEAKQTAQVIEHSYHRPQTLFSVAKAQAEAGDIEGAKQTAQAIEDDGYRSDVLAYIAKAQAEAGDIEFKDTIEEAKQTAEKIEHNDYRFRVLASIAKAQAEAGAKYLKNISVTLQTSEIVDTIIDKAVRIHDRKTIAAIGSISDQSAVSRYSEEYGQDVRDLLDHGYMKVHISPQEEQEMLFERYSIKLHQITEGSDPAYSANRLTTEILASLNAPDMIRKSKETLAQTAEELSPTHKLLPRILKALIEINDSAARYSAMRIAAQKDIPERIFEYMVHKLVNVGYLPPDSIQYLNDKRDVQALRQLISQYPNQTINTIQIIAKIQNFSLHENKDLLFEAIADLGALTPTIFERYKQADAKGRKDLAERINELKPKFFKNEPIKDILDPDDQAILAEMVYLAYKPIGMSYEQVADLLEELKDCTHHLDEYEFQEQGYEFVLRSGRAYELKPGEEINEEHLKNVLKVFFASYPKTEELKEGRQNSQESDQKRSTKEKTITESLEESLLRLAKAGTTPNMDEVALLCSLMADEDLVSKFREKYKSKNLSQMSAVEKYAFLNHSIELLGVYYNDNYSHCLEDYLNNHPDTLEKLQTVLANPKRFNTLVGRVKSLKKRDLSHIDPKTTQGMAELLTAYLSSAYISKLLITDTKIELKKFRVSDTQENQETNESVGGQKLKAYVSKNAASFFAKASAGICTAQDVGLFQRKDHFHINIVENESTVKANIQAYIINDSKEGQSLLIRGINPNVAFLDQIDVGAFCEQVLEIARKFKEDNGLTSVYITGQEGGWHALSNRTQVEAYLKKYIKPEREVDVAFDITGSKSINVMYDVGNVS
jgi:hypothetical protein